MAQRHVEQWGTFHITTNAHAKIPWCTWEGVPEILIRDLTIAASIYESEVIAYCVLPNHMHFICVPGGKGLSRFVQSFKSNSSRNIREYLFTRSTEHVLRATEIKNTIDHTSSRSRGSATPASFTGWQNGFHDERIRDDRQLDEALRYVRHNASLHHLIEDPLDWPWTSLPRFQ